MANRAYSVSGVVSGLQGTLIEYLEAQYHIWNESLVRERRLLLEEPGVTSQLPFLEATPSYRYSVGYDGLAIPNHAKQVLARCADIPGTGVYPRPFVHQAGALEAIFSRGNQLIVATGTGSGKTESFLLPILASLAMEANERPSSRDLPGCRALLLYPMNALVNDQLGRLRRLFGNTDVAKAVAGKRLLPYRFAMYTSRTPYPGQQDNDRDRLELRPLLQRLFQGLSREDEAMLRAEGKWPAKDIDAFLGTKFQTAATDRELFTRQEVQAACPELLVTNYSMLEYMLLRPIEAGIFDQTRRWLSTDPRNVLTIVLDEAHMYRGAQGAEVALLLRRLQSRLDIPRDRIRYILTSASFGTSPDAQRSMLKFAGNLTGVGGAPFEIVKSEIEGRKGSAPASANESVALGNFSYDSIQGVLDGVRLEAAAHELQRLGESVGAKTSGSYTNEEALRELAYTICERLPSAALLSERITGRAYSYSSAASEVFPSTTDSAACLESLLALVTFAKKATDERPFLPVRLHLLFRGISGVFACVNRNCTARRSATGPTLLGRLHDSPKLRCDCGARVYEVLTHRDCGAAFIRAYIRDSRADFLWHEPPAHHNPGAPVLMEAHFLVESDRDRSTGSAQLWLHARTGRMVTTRPTDETDYLSVKRPPGLVSNHTPPLMSFDGECPVCLREWRGTSSRIMDLTTKGEQPFAHLIKTQVRLQPASRRQTARFPNSGRKSLLFSDGRQKAARLARNIPREIEQDTFRQLLMLAVRNLRELNKDAVPTDTILYLGFVDAVAHQNVEMFDGADATTLARHVADYREYYQGQLADALNDNFALGPPPRYREGLLKQLGAPFYSLSALTLAYVAPKPFVARRLHTALPNLPKEDIESIAVIWIQNFLDRFAFDQDITASIRNSAAGWRRQWGESTGYRRNQRRQVDAIFQDAGSIQNALFGQLTVDKHGARFLEPNKLHIVPAYEAEWYQCASCTFLAPVTWRGACANCGEKAVFKLDFGSSIYLRARKTFWRDPVIRVLDGTEQAFSLDVQEHTAQLNYRDTEKPDSTTEVFERRFRDILVGPNERPIDVLSCTTTMEVGIDIGSLVAVGLRNVPPQRQNYQQRAGRAGRRGSSVSTVLTYAQNNPHDSHYFEDPYEMIAGSPPDPSVDSDNPTIISRHANAQLLQTFFHGQSRDKSASGQITTVLGATIEFFHGSGDFTIDALSAWLLSDSEDVRACFGKLEAWLPSAERRSVVQLASDLVSELQRIAPDSNAQLITPQNQLLEYLFSNGVLPSYAFPRHLLALQIEKREGVKVRTVERPQQSLAVALSEYAPGRWVVVNKETYKVGTVAANAPSTERDRAVRLFQNARQFVQCPNCFHTELDRDLAGSEQCPICRNAALARIEIIQPEVAFPDGAGPIDELGDEQVFTDVTSAQLPYPRGGQSLNFTTIGNNARVAHGHNEELVVVNRGESSAQGGTGFLVCERCGKSQLPSAIPAGRHDRDYLIQDPTTRRQPPQCDGLFRPVYLGYTFPTDILVLRVTLQQPFNDRYDDIFHRRPLVDAARSLSEALALAATTRLDIDPRELKAGFRFLTIREERVVDIFLYDTLAGGAGYASMSGKLIRDIARDTEVLLQRCNCTSSCDRCLRAYDNRFFHHSLNRFLALELLCFAVSSVIPTELSTDAQRSKLEPLVEFLQLEGWDVSNSRSGAFSIRHGSASHDIGCYPSLRDLESIQAAAPQTMFFSEYEIANALPDAAARVVR